MVTAEQLIKKHGRLFSEELGIKLRSGKDPEVFKWFLASVLFGKRIGVNIAMATYKEFVKYRLASPRAIEKAGWDKLVEVLDEGGYVRYDESTASRLLEMMTKLRLEYGSSLNKLHREARDPRDLEARLMGFKGIGPVTVGIFLRELRGIWPKADPEPNRYVKQAARRLRIDLKKLSRRSQRFARLECALFRWAKAHK
ncbi:MAG: hypothetical protein ACE5FW_00210 [Candidatus Aenigmatarchaeota archaeon]